MKTFVMFEITREFVDYLFNMHAAKGFAGG